MPTSLRQRRDTNKCSVAGLAEIAPVVLVFEAFARKKMGTDDSGGGEFWATTNDSGPTGTFGLWRLFVENKLQPDIANSSDDDAGGVISDESAST